jgi:hypothetical protein
MPDRWVILKFTSPKQTFYKVLAGWYSDYLNADSLRISSGLTKIVEEGDVYLIHNESGSIYKCHKEAEGLNSTTAICLESIKDKLKATQTKVELSSVENFSEYLDEVEK